MSVPAGMAQGARSPVNDRVRKRRRSRLQDDGGPPIVVVFCALDGGRWSRCLATAGDEATALRQRLQASASPGSSLESGVVAGFGVIAGWRKVQDRFSSWDSSLLATAVCGIGHRRQVPRFLEHRVLDSAVVDMSWTLRCGPLHYGSDIGVRVLGMMQEFHPRVIARTGRPVDTRDLGNSLPQLLREWSRKWEVPCDRLVPWPVCPEVAHALARGRLCCDLSVIWHRELYGEDHRAPCGRLRTSIAVIAHQVCCTISRSTRSCCSSGGYGQG